MQTVTLGRTGLTVSAAGLGCGGHSRLGQSQGASETESVALVRAALDRGVSFIDTAAAYDTEAIVGKAIQGRRDAVVLSSKIQVVKPGTRSAGNDFISAEAFMAAAEDSLRRLDTDCLDILHLHGVAPDQYAYCREVLVPVLLTLRDQGKIRFLGITERFIYDPSHKMLDRALEDDCWDVMMVGHSLLNPSARHSVFPRTQAKGIGTLIMFAVRRALSDPTALRALLEQMIADGVIAPDAIDLDSPLDFLAAPDVAASIVEAAYRFCRHEPGAEVILTGTGKVAHLDANIASICAGPLPAVSQARLREIFGTVDSVSGN